MPAPGTYSFSIGLKQFGASVELEVAITGPTEQRFDVDVPVGSIAGRVHGPDGPVEGIAVVFRRGPLADGSQTSAYAQAMTRKDGRYSVWSLPAGTWTVQAGGTEEHRYGSEPSLYTRAIVENVFVASGQRATDVDLHLGTAGTIAGRVLTAAGEPAQGAQIRARLPSGGEIEELEPAKTGEDGSFAIGGLEPGTYALGAFHGLHQGAEVEVDVEAGKQSQVELRLAPATLVRVVVRDAQGASVKARITCQRSDGADFSSWINRSSKETPEGEHRLGPLPPATYTLQADLQGAAPGTKTVTLKGEPEILVELVL